MNSSIATKRMWIKRTRAISFVLTEAVQCVFNVLSSPFRFIWIIYKNDGVMIAFGISIVLAIVGSITMAIVYEGVSVVKGARIVSGAEITAFRNADACYNGTLLRRVEGFNGPVLAKHLWSIEQDCKDWHAKQGQAEALK